MSKEDVKIVVCPIGGINFPVGNLVLGDQFGDRIVAGRTGLCTGCKREWDEKARGSKVREPLKVVIEDNEDKNHTATVVSCDNAFTD
jgi:hypothetical protein